MGLQRLCRFVYNPMSWLEICTEARCRLGFSAGTSLVKKKTVVDTRGSLFAASHAEEYEVEFFATAERRRSGGCMCG